MTVRCYLLGHRRSASRATFDEKRQRWLSDCKRCHVLLVRGDDGKWRPAPPPPDKLETIRHGLPAGKDEPEAEPQEQKPTSLAAASRGLS